MHDARNTTSIQVNDTIPVQFDLPVQTQTTVVLTQDTNVSGARVGLSTGRLTILSAPTDILLPAGTQLLIALVIVVPVDTTIPINLTVPVDIPLNETELH